MIFIPGGPMLAAAYLDDLGGLSEKADLALLDLRGTGGSEAPADPESYRCDRQVDDIEALRRHLGLERIDLAGHSAGATIAVLYAARYPERIGHLLLATPSPRVSGVEVTDDDRRGVAEMRRGEPWFDKAFAAFERIWAEDDTDDDWDAITPFSWGHWDADTERLVETQDALRNPEAAAGYYAAGAFEVDAVRASIAKLSAPVLLIAGQYDVVLPPARAADFAALFPNAELKVIAGAGHQPWRDDADAFTSAVTTFLRDR
ncbi:MAG TPA: alpha/beta hydrolase [Micromonosporaceae bacterium]